MPITVLPRVALPLVAGLLIVLVPGSASAATTPGQLRVVADGKELANQTQHTRTARVRTSPKARCFGPGTGGSGDRHRTAGPNALGIIKHGMARNKKLRPLMITDHFSFGLGICGIGGHVAPRAGFWYLKVNRAASTSGGEGTRVRRGDQILWYLIRDFNRPTPAELVVDAPRRAQPNRPFEVRVTAFDDGGNPSPAAGAQVSGAVAPTGADGRTTIVPQPGTVNRVRATRPGDIPSALAIVCSGSKAKACERPRSGPIFGTNGADRIRASRFADRIHAGRGKDTIDVRPTGKGRVDRVNCGPARDRVIARRGQRVNVAQNCQRVVRR
jgi:hypothetical protein